MTRGSAHTKRLVALSTLGVLLVAGSPIARADSGGAGLPVAVQPVTKAPKAKITRQGIALAPKSAPIAVKRAIWAANKITDKPYIYGGGHRRWDDRGYDCSGAASYVLRAAGVLDSPLDAVQLGRLRVMKRGKGKWISYYWNHGHGYLVVAGRRFDTSGPGESGPRWRKTLRADWSRFREEHPKGF